MTRPDDSSLTPEQYTQVRLEASRILTAAGALGRFPTPTVDLLQVAHIEEVEEDVLNLSLIERLRHKASDALKRALAKVEGIFDAVAGLIYIDRTLHICRQNFIRLHEAGHGFMQWQRRLYKVVEECERSLDPELADSFDREANVFAAEVLFQLDSFTNEARDSAFDIKVPINLAKRYGASNYAAIRRYVSQSQHNCTVLVLEKPQLVPGEGFRVDLRRVISSERFSVQFGKQQWPQRFTPDDQIGASVPILPKRMSGRRQMTLTDANGQIRQCLAEAFNTGWNVFVLIRVID